MPRWQRLSALTATTNRTYTASQQREWCRQRIRGWSCEEDCRWVVGERRLSASSGRHEPAGDLEPWALMQDAGGPSPHPRCRPPRPRRGNSCSDAIGPGSPTPRCPGRCSPAHFALETPLSAPAPGLGHRPRERWPHAGRPPSRKGLGRSGGSVPSGWGKRPSAELEPPQCRFPAVVAKRLRQ